MIRCRIVSCVSAICLSALIGTPCSASSWPNSIFDGAASQIVQEINAHQDLVEQAFSYLHPCPVPDDDGMCLNNQQDFVLDYIYAFYNDHAAQRNLAYWLSNDDLVPESTNPNSTQEPGIIPNPMWGCAWRIAIISSGGTEFMNNDLDEYKIACQTILSPQDQNGANAIAYTILLKIHNYIATGAPPKDLVN